MIAVLELAYASSSLSYILSPPHFWWNNKCHGRKEDRTHYCHCLRPESSSQHHRLGFFSSMNMIHLLHLSENYFTVKATITHQRLVLICVFKKNGYVHGLMQTVMLPADVCGANTFSVGILE